MKACFVYRLNDLENMKADFAHIKADFRSKNRLTKTMWQLFALGSAFFAALTAIFTKIGVENVPSNLATAIRTSVVLILAWGLVIFRGEGAQMGAISRVSLVWLLVSGMATGLSWLCYFRALQSGPVSMVAPLDKLSLPLTIILAALFLGETLKWQTVLGLVLVASGTYFLTR